jgi:hypothetical protein
MSPHHLNLQPIYGYGWYDAVSSGQRDTPSPFAVRVTDTRDGQRSGTVETPGHEFEGQTVQLSQRHVEADGAFNVHIDGVASGWAIIR